MLTGIGGVGKSTLAALCYHASQAPDAIGTNFFAAPPLWLSVDSSTTFADVAGTLFQAVGQPIPELGSLSPSNQAAALFTLFDAAGTSRLVVLDQFENLLDWTTGSALPAKAGVGEWLDALNGQCWSGGSRMLLTSRPRPKGTRAYPPMYLQEYSVEGLTMAEGLDLLRKRDVRASERDLRSAVSACNGHALSLTLLIALVEEYGMSLAILLADPALWEGDIATNLLDAMFQRLSEVQRDVLRACSVFRIPVSIEAISTLLGTASTREIQRAIRTLLTQHLFQRVEEGRYHVHAIVASYAKHHFVEGDEQANHQAVQAAHAQAAHFYLQQAETLCPPWEQRRLVSEVQPFIEAIWHNTQADQWQEAYRVSVQERLFGSLRLWGANVLVLELCQLLLPRAQWQPTPDQAATLYLNLGRVYNSLGQKPQVLDYYQQALAIYREVGDRGGEGVTLFNIGAVLFLQQQDISLAAFLLAKHLFEEVQSPYQYDVQSWIDSLRDAIGEEQFVLLVAQVEPHAQQVFEQFLHKQ